MPTNLLENIKTQLTPDMVQQISALLDETSATTQKALDSVLPTLLAGVMHFSASGSGATQLGDILTHNDYSTVLNNLSSLLENRNTAEKMMRSGQNILNRLLAGKLLAVSDLITKYSGIKNTSASLLLSLAAPVVLGVITRVRSEQHLNVVDLATLLQGQRHNVSRLTPVGLEKILELYGEADRTVEHTDTITANKVLRISERRYTDGLLPSWGWLGLGIIVLIVVYWLWERGLEEKPPLVAAPNQTTTRNLVSSSPTPNVMLPGGTALFLKEGSCTYQLAMFLADSQDEVVPRGFVLDQLHFAPDTVLLTPDSEQVVKDLSAILAAYPAADVQLQGYTASEGDMGANQKLVLERTEVIKLALIRSGIASTRFTTVDDDDQNSFVTARKTEYEQAQEQRLELVVMRK